jgi:acyl-CoA synthetase (NDP forming)
MAIGRETTTEGALKRLLDPESIAVLGASNSEGKPGNAIARRLAATYRGRLSFINPRERQVLGRPALASIAGFDGIIDLLVALVPGQSLVEAVRQAPPGKARFLAAIPSGFGELPQGEAMQAELVALARERNMRVLGPNSVGIVNTGLELNASLVPELPVAGCGLSCLTQSGGFVMSVYMYSRNHDLPVAKLVDLGNTSDIRLEELLDHLATDAETASIGLFLEAADWRGDLLARLEEIAHLKPVILTQIARTTAGRRASRAHIGFALDPRASGTCPPIITAESGIELLHIAKALAVQPLPRGPRVGILTGSGGIGTELADLCLEHGLDVPVLSARLQQRLGAHLPPYAALSNPVDTTPVWQDFPQIYPPLIETMLGSGEVDLLITTITDVPSSLVPFMEALASVAGSGAARRLGGPVYVFWSSVDEHLQNRHILECAGVPCYPTPRDAVRVAAALYGFGASRAHPTMHKTSG